MSFFEPPTPVELPSQPPTPPWVEPPQNEVGVGVPLEPFVLFRNTEVALAVIGVVAYSTGFEFQFSARGRGGAAVEIFDPVTHSGLHRQRAGASELPDELLRFGIEFADGRKATNVGGHPGMSGDDPPGPTLMERSGSGGVNRWDQFYWVWPLPPVGSLAFVCEWPQMKVPLTRREFDASAIIDAAGRAEVLWPPEPPVAGGWTSTTEYATTKGKSAG